MRVTQKFTMAVTIAISTIVITATPINADDKQEVSVRPASLKDLEGTWRMVEISLMSHFNRVDPFVLPHQRYHFAANQKMKVITSTPPFKKQLLDIFDSRDPATTFRIADDGEVTITSLAWRNKNKFTARLVISGKPNGDKHPMVGDLILTWPGPQRKPAAVKLMRRVVKKIRRGQTIQTSN